MTKLFNLLNFVFIMYLWKSLQVYIFFTVEGLLSMDHNYSPYNKVIGGNRNKLHYCCGMYRMLNKQVFKYAGLDKLVLVLFILFCEIISHIGVVYRYMVCLFLMNWISPV